MASSLDLGTSWSNSEGVLDPLARSSIHYIKELPVNLDREWVLVLECELLRLTDSSRIGKLEIEEVTSGSDVPHI